MEFEHRMTSGHGPRLGVGALAAPGALFALAAAFALAKTSRDSAFLAAGGLTALPVMYASIALLSVPFGFVTLALMRTVGGRRAQAWMSIATAIGLWGLSARPPTDVGLPTTIAYVAVPLAFGVLFSMTWLVVPYSVVTPEGALHPHAYLLAGAAALGGGVSGGVVAAAVAGVVGAAELFASAGVLVVLGARLLASAPCAPGPSPVVAPSATLDEGTAPAPPPFLLLGSAAALTAIVGVFVEYQFYASIAESAGASDATARLAALHIGINGVALVGLLVTPWLHQRAGVGGTLALLPAAVAAGATAIWVGGAASSRAVLRATEGGLKASVHRVSWEQVLLLLPEAARPRTKMMLDGMATRVAEGCAGLLLWTMVGVGATPRVLTAALVILATLWLVAAVRLWHATAHLASGAAMLGGGRLPDS